MQLFDTGMITTTASHATSLFQFIDDQRSSAQFVGDMGELAQNNASQDSKDIDSGLVNVQSMDTLVDRVMSGESKVTGEKVNDMLSFYFNQVKRELENTAGDFFLQNVPPLQITEGQWQLASSGASQGASPQTGNKNLNNFISYLNKDERLSSRMEKAIKLSELNEQIQARNSAQTLKNENIPDGEITSFLITTSDKLQANRFLSIEQGSVKLGNAGIAKKQLPGGERSAGDSLQ